jgi:hypothetical protein
VYASARTCSVAPAARELLPHVLAAAVLGRPAAPGRQRAELAMARRPPAPVRAGGWLPHRPPSSEHPLRRRELARPDAPEPSPRGRQLAHLSPPGRCRHAVHRAATAGDIGECAERRAEKYGGPAPVVGVLRVRIRGGPDARTPNQPDHYR